ncbi:MAG: lysophospholipid acyltransferase family protein [Bacteriovoracaceae bacterium]|nr:lysophospholipid acyltransferase family protein [Bacteriovoracaceae bacterium]
MIEELLDQYSPRLSKKDQAKKELVFRKLQERYKHYKDPWGFHLPTVKTALELILPIYKKYFKVRVFGLENLQDKPYMIVSNHTGQIPIDGMLITMALAYEPEKPRIIHSMIERFMAGLPFIADFSAQTGSILGDRENCKWLLRQGESILVFPEGVKGINKPTKNFYELQKFSSGFYRIALQSQTEILPITVIGAEEMFPIVFQAASIGKKLGLPNLPLPLNLFPLPSPIDIYIGEPIQVPSDLSPEAPEKDLRPYISEIEKEIKKNIKIGLKSKRDFLNWLNTPIKNFIKKF